MKHLTGWCLHFSLQTGERWFLYYKLSHGVKRNPCAKDSIYYNFIHLSFRFSAHWISSSPFHLVNPTCLFTFTMAFICKPVLNVVLLLTLKWTHLISLACLITMGTSDCSRALNYQRLMKTNVQKQVGRIAFWACVIGHAWEGGTGSLWFIVWCCPRTTTVCCPSMP